MVGLIKKLYDGFSFSHTSNLTTSQVVSILKLLEHLPDQGCKYCLYADPPNGIGVEGACVCDDIFLRSLPPAEWRRTHRTWYARARCGEKWRREVTSKASELAGCEIIYTNSCFRPTTVTTLSSAGYSNRVTQQITGQKTLDMVSRYNRQAEQMRAEDWRQAGILMAPSGRQAMRGGENKFGSIAPEATARNTVGNNYRRMVDQRAGLSALHDSQVSLVRTSKSCY